MGFYSYLKPSWGKVGLVNARGLHLEFAIVLHETLRELVLIYGRETMIWIEEERSRIRAVQLDHVGSLLGTRRME